MIIRGSNSFPARRDVVTIECNVTANPPANITWMKRTNQRIQILANTQRITITHQFTYTPGGPTSRSTLTVYDVEAADNGDYICEASNGPSSPSLSADFTVCVIGISQLILELTHIMFFLLLCVIIAQGSVIVTPRNHQIIQSERAQFNCTVCPTLAPLLTWNFTRRGGHKSEMIVNQGQPFSSQYAVTVGEGNETLIIESTQWRHVGVYKCIASIDGTVIAAETSLDVLSELTILYQYGFNASE